MPKKEGKEAEKVIYVKTDIGEIIDTFLRAILIFIFVGGIIIVILGFGEFFKENFLSGVSILIIIFIFVYLYFSTKKKK